MYLKGVCVLFLTTAILWFDNVNALPRDSGVIKTEPVTNKQDIITLKVKDPSEESGNKAPAFLVACDFDETLTSPADDVVCQDHCLRKGYSYGLCWRGKCSCI